jgi:hypothetical protein
MGVLLTARRAFAEALAPCGSAHLRDPAEATGWDVWCLWGTWPSSVPQQLCYSQTQGELDE